MKDAPLDRAQDRAMIPAKAGWGLDSSDWQTLSAIAGVLAFVGFLFQWRATARRDGRNDLMVEIRAPITRAELIRQYDRSRAARYDAWLGRALGLAQDFYGPRWSLKSLGTCLSLAFIYPLIAALIAWVASGQTDIGPLPIFPEMESMTRRLMTACLFLIVSSAAVLMVYAGLKYSGPAGVWAQSRLEPITGRASILTKSARPVIEWTSIVLAGAIAGAFVVAASGGLSIAGTFAVAIAGCVALFGAFSGGVISAVSGSIAGSIVEDWQLAALILFLYLLLPVANAMADWASVSVTRWFLQQAHDHRQRGWALVGFMFLDFLAGLACLVVLLCALVGFLDLWSLLAAPPFDWRAYWQAAQDDRSAGIALWLMCFTTLLPTLLHLAWALVVWLFDLPKATRYAVEEMRHWDDTASDADQAAFAMRIAGRLQAGQRAAFLRFVGLLAVLVPITMYFEIWSLTGVSELLSSASERQ